MRNARLLGDFRVMNLERLPHVAIDRASLRQPDGDGVNDAAMAPGEETLAEERRCILAEPEQQRIGHEPSRIRIRIRERVDLPSEIADRLRRLIAAGHDHVRAIQRLALPGRNRKQAHAVAIAYVRETADPGRVELLCEQQFADFAVAATLDEGDGTAELALQIALPIAQNATSSSRKTGVVPIESGRCAVSPARRRAVERRASLPRDCSQGSYAGASRSPGTAR